MRRSVGVLATTPHTYNTRNNLALPNFELETAVFGDLKSRGRSELGQVRLPKSFWAQEKKQQFSQHPLSGINQINGEAKTLVLDLPPKFCSPIKKKPDLPSCHFRNYNAKSEKGGKQASLK